MSLLYLVWTGLRYMSNKRFSTSLVVLYTLLSTHALSLAAEWTLTPTGSKASLRAITAVNDYEVWASGTDGTVFRTLDEGAHWTKMVGLPADLDFRGLQTFDGRAILLMSAGSGQKSRIYRSGDSGQTWKLVHQNQLPDAFFDSIALYDALRGLVLGDPVNGKFFLLATADGGTTWTKLDGPSAREGEGAFAASNTSLVTTHAGLAWFGTGGVLGARVFSSYDWGRTWTPVSTTIQHDNPTSGVFSVAFPDPKHGLATGGDYKKPESATQVLSETNDGGASWHALEGLRGYRSAIATDGHHVFVTGPARSEYRPGPRADWQPIAGEGFHALSIAPKGKLVWACGSGGRVAHFRIK